MNIRLILIGILLSLSCNKGQINTNIIAIEEGVLKNSFNVEETFKKIEKILLDDIKGKPLGQLLKVVEVGECYIILFQYNDYNQRYIAGFKKTGEFIFLLEPNEDNLFNFNPRDLAQFEENTFEVLEGNSNSLILFNAQGQQLRKKNLKIKIANFAYDEKNHQYAFHKNFQAFSQADTSIFYNLIFTDSSFNIIHNYFPFSIKEGERSIINFPFPLQNGDDGKIYFAKVFSDSIYCFQNGLLQPHNAFIFDMPGNKSALVENTQQGMDIQAFVDEGGYLLAGWYVVLNNRLSFNFVTKDSPAWGIYNSKTGDLKIGRHAVEANGIFFPPPIAANGNGEFISFLNDFSLQYVPESLIDNEIMHQIIQKGETYLFIAK